jgi:hypothetical protein
LIHPPFLSNDRLILALVSACGARRLNVGWSLNEQCSPERGIVRDANDAESTAGGDAGPCACVELGELSAASSVRALPDDHRLEVLGVIAPDRGVTLCSHGVRVGFGNAGSHATGVPKAGLAKSE